MDLFGSNNDLDIGLSQQESKMRVLMQITAAILTKAKPTMEKNGISAKVFSLGEPGTFSSGLRSRTLVITMQTKDDTGKDVLVYRPISVLEGNEVYPPSIVGGAPGQGGIELTRTHSDQDEDVLRSTILTAIEQSFGDLEGLKIEGLKSSVMSSDLVQRVMAEDQTAAPETHVEALRFIGGVVQSIYASVTVTLTSKTKDIQLNIPTEDRGAGTLQLTLSSTQNRAPYTTGSGVMLKPDIQIGMDIFTGNTVRRDSIHGEGDKLSIGTVDININANYQAGKTTILPQAKGQSELNCWVPTINLTNIHSNGTLTIGRYLLAMATTTTLYDPLIIRTALTDKMRYLNIRSNALGAAKPTALTKKAVSEYADRLHPALFVDGVATTITVYPGEMEYATTSAFATPTSVNKRRIEKSIRDMFNLGASVEIPPMFAGNVDVQVVGRFVNPDSSSGEVLPLSCIDIAYILKHYPEDQELQARWVSAHNPATDLRVRLAQKQALLRTITNGQAEITDKAWVLTVSPVFMRWLREQVNASNLNIHSNNNMVITDNSKWNNFVSGASYGTWETMNNGFTSGPVDTNNSTGIW